MSIMELLNHINARGTTVLVATHDQAVVDRMRRRVVRFERGQLTADEQDGAYWEQAVVKEQKLGSTK